MPTSTETTLDQLRSALERVEAATEPDREIDWLITNLQDFEVPSDPAGWPPRFTASLDIVTALIEREMPDHLWFGQRTRDDKREYVWVVWTSDEEETAYSSSSHSNPALALLAAFLRALIAEAEQAGQRAGKAS